MADLPAPGRLGLGAEAAILPAVLRARSARARRDGAAVTEEVARCLRRVFPGSQIGDPAPFLGSRGGFFAALATVDGRRLFVKAILARGRESRFWTATQDGRIRTAGRHYRLLVPERIIAGRAVCLLVTPAMEALADDSARTRRHGYRKASDLVLRAMGEFNATHFPAVRGLPGPRREGRPRRPPTAAALAQGLGLEPREAAAAAARLGKIGEDWGPVRARLAAMPRCLSHLDLGPGNIRIVDGRGLLLDFGHASAAPAGADLHSLLRYGGGRRDLEQLSEEYAAIFAANGMALDPEAARFAAVAHFAERYRDLHSVGPRGIAAFHQALELSEVLIAGVGRSGPAARIRM